MRARNDDCLTRLTMPYQARDVHQFLLSKPLLLQSRCCCIHSSWFDVSTYRRGACIGLRMPGAFTGHWFSSSICFSFFKDEGRRNVRIRRRIGLILRLYPEAGGKSYDVDFLRRPFASAVLPRAATQFSTYPETKKKSWFRWP